MRQGQPRSRCVHPNDNLFPTNLSIRTPTLQQCLLLLFQFFPPQVCGAFPKLLCTLLRSPHLGTISPDSSCCNQLPAKAQHSGKASITTSCFVFHTGKREINVVTMDGHRSKAARNSASQRGLRRLSARALPATASWGWVRPRAAPAPRRAPCAPRRAPSPCRRCLQTRGPGSQEREETLLR